MQVVLQKDVPSLGDAGDQVTVKDGYARNFLIPKRLAVRSNKGTVKVINELKRRRELKAQKAKKDQEKLAGEIQKLSLTIAVKVADEEKLYGSVTAGQIAELIIKEGVQIEKKAVELQEPIKKLGVYNVPVKLSEESTATVKVWVVKE